MKRDDIVGVLRAHESELREAGIASLSLFGSVARGDDRPDSDVDLVAKILDREKLGGFAYFGKADALRCRLEVLLAKPVSLVVEPVQKESLRIDIERDRFVAF